MADSPKTEMPPSGEDYYHISTDVKVTPVNRFYYRATPPWVWWIKRAIQSDAWNGRHAKDAEWLIIAFKAGLQWIPVVTVCTSEALMDPPQFPVRDNKQLLQPPWESAFNSQCLLISMLRCRHLLVSLWSGSVLTCQKLFSLWVFPPCTVEYWVFSTQCIHCCLSEVTLT